MAQIVIDTDELQRLIRETVREEMRAASEAAASEVVVDMAAVQRRVSAHTRRVYRERYSTQMEAANAMGTSQGNLSGVMRGTKTVGLEFVLKLARISGCSVETLCFEECAKGDR